MLRIRAAAVGSGMLLPRAGVRTLILAGYDRVFLIAAGLGLAIAAVSLLLPRHRRR